MRRRCYLSLLGAAAFAGCTGSEGTADSAADEANGTEAEPTSTRTPSPTSTPESKTTAEESKGVNYRVRIKYDGAWHGSVATAGKSVSIQGSGEKTIDVDGDPDVLSVTAQKRDAGTGESLSVKILKNGEVVKRASTEAEFGVAQTSLAGVGGGSSAGSGSEQSPYSVRVAYDGEWHGSVSTGGSSRSIQGTGEQTVDVAGDPTVVSASVQKRDGGGRKLTVQVLRDGEVVKKASTTAEYGVVSVSVMG